MHEQQPTHTRPSPDPESPMTNSLYHATSNIDDITHALANFSRVPSPEPPSVLTCCCGKEDCESLKSWLAFKSKLESRLVLSAEVGQALLQRHEAYVRRREGRTLPRHSPQESVEDSPPTQDHEDIRIEELLKDNAVLEKRLTQALINNEVSEASNKAVLDELEEARNAISRLTAHHARSSGWETRLMLVSQERDDMRQERDSETQRAKVADGRIAVLKERISKLQEETRHLQESLEQRRRHRLQSSESILQDARARIEMLQSSERGHTAMAEETEVTKVLESLVDDNETLKRDNAELQTLLAQSREDVHGLQEEVAEQRANPPSHVGTTQASHLNASHLFHPASTSFSVHASRTFQSRKRNLSAEPSTRRAYEPLTPETIQRPLSPENLQPSETKFSSLTMAQPNLTPSHTSFELNSDEHDAATSPVEKVPIHKTLFLLSRSRGVQTDAFPGLLAPSPQPSIGATSSSSPHEPQSESSSLADNMQSSHISILLERVVSLVQRVTQADALTLTNRLKRHHLKGDVGHLSRTTVSSILSEVAALRTQFRPLLEDNKAIITCTRKDLRGLFQLFKDIFMEMGEMRVTLNDVILDPKVAYKIRASVMDPMKKDETTAGSSTTGWMAPISKLFGGTNVSGEDNQPVGGPSPLRRAPSQRGTMGPPPRVIPKLEPALAASTTTVNVEFSGSGVGRSVTSTFSANPRRKEGNAIRTTRHTPGSMDVSKNLMGIFAGAPKNTSQDPWVVVPNGARRAQRTGLNSDVLQRRAIGNNANRRLSQNVDAVIDVNSPQEGEEADFVAPLLQRTLRRRGLSDSSIHSTFTNQEDEPLPPHATLQDGLSPRQTMPDRTSVLQSLSRTVQSFRFPAAVVASQSSSRSETPVTESSSPKPSSIGAHRTFSSNSAEHTAISAPSPVPKTSPGSSSFVPLSMASLAGAATAFGTEPFYVGSAHSAREDSLLHRTRGRQAYTRDMY